MNILRSQYSISLTRREREILDLVALGNTDKLISKQLFISSNTVETHRRRLLQKFDVNNSCALIYRACKVGLL